MATPPGHQMSRRGPAGPALLARAWIERLVSVQLVDRAVALAGLAFTALVPLLIVYDAVVPTIDGRDFATDLADRFELKGAAAESLRQALASPAEVTSGFSVLGVVLVVFSVLSFARALQRLYEQAFRLPALGGVRGTPSTVLWLALIPAVLTVGKVIDALLGGGLAVVADLALGAVVWTMSPYILLGRRLGWRPLVPTGVTTAVAMSILGVASVIWLPRAVAESAERYGLIGVAFALLSWLVAAGFTLVGSAAAGAVMAERWGAAAERG
jgi:membrane protein